MPKLVEFMESLTQEQDKLVMMGTIKPSKDKALVAIYLRVDSKRKKKSKNPPEQKRDKNKSQEEPQGFKKNSQKKKNKGPGMILRTPPKFICIKIGRISRIYRKI